MGPVRAMNTKGSDCMGRPLNVFLLSEGGTAREGEREGVTEGTGKSQSVGAGS